MAKGQKSFAALLQDRCKAWQDMNETVLKKRMELLKLLASGFYDPGYTRWHTLNLVDRGISTVVPYLVEGNPKALVEARIANLRPWALTTQLALNFFIEKLDLARNVLVPAAVNSMVGAGITRTDFYHDRLISLNDTVIPLGSPSVELIDDSNYIGDPSARRRSDFVMEGDVYKLPTDYAKEFFSGKDKYGNQIADYITSDCRLSQDVSPRDISNPNFEHHKLSLREYTTFIDVFLRDSNTIVTILPYGRKAKILREREWEGPGNGPYDYLGYKFFPETPIPIPPAWSWHDMDVTVNILIDKMRESAENAKDVIAYSSEAADDMANLVKAPHLGTVQVGDVASMKPISFNGIKDDSLWNWVTFMLQEHPKQGANPEILGGRGASAPTFGQEQLMYTNATRIVNNMYTRFHDFMVGIFRKLAWAFWVDPTTYVPVIRDVPGVGPLPAIYSSVDKVEDFYDFVYKIEPFSTQRMSPEAKYQRLMQFMANWTIPTMPLAAQQGASLNVPLVSQILADYSGIENFNQFYQTTIPGVLDQVQYQMQPSKSPGQGSDVFGALEGSRQANLNQQQNRTAMKGQESEGQENI